MNTSISITDSAISKIDESKIIWAIMASILLHVLFVTVIPNFKFDPIKKEQQVLKIEIQTPPPPVETPQPPVVIPKPIKPLPKIVKPKKPKPKPVVEPKPIEPLPPEEPVPSPPIIEEVIAIAPPPVPEPEAVVVPQPVPIEPLPEPTKPNQAEIDLARNQYGSLLGQNIAKYKSYPKIAMRRGWQGKVILDLKIDGSGNVISVKVIKSSGHSILDKEALKMANKAAPFPKPPSALQSQSFNITVPVSFKLNSG